MTAKTTTPKPTPPRNTSLDPATAWAQAVVAGKIVQGPHVRNACRRHLQDLKDGKKRGLVWDVEAAARIIGFCRDVLRLAGGQFEGRPFVPDPSQAFILGSLFGWKRRDGTRRFRRAYIEIGKGNGKSPLSAAMGMYGLVADKEDRAEIYSVGKDKNQSFVLFRDAVAMWQQSPALKKRLTKSGGVPVWNLADLQTGSFFRPISKEEASSGPRPYFALIDEVHEHPDGTAIEMMERGFKSRNQPMLVMTTNSGSDRKSVCWNEHEHAVKVAAGNRDIDDLATYVGDVIDDTTFSFVCGLDLNDDPLEDPSCWIKANPLLGVTITHEYLAGVVAQAKMISGKLNNILRLHFCVWTDADRAWMSRATIESCLADFDPIDLSGEEAFCGLDLSGSQDMTALAFVVPCGFKMMPGATDADPLQRLPCYDAWVEAWTPGDTVAERAVRDRAPYDMWVKNGWLNAPPGKQIRLNFVATRMAEASAQYQIGMAAYDNYAYRALEQELDELGINLPMAEHPQGSKRRGKVPDEYVKAAEESGQQAPQGLWMPGSLATLETLIIEGRIRIQRSPVVISALNAVTTQEDALGNRWMSKMRATGRIDAAVALVMAVGAATAGWYGKPKSFAYDNHGIRFFG